MILLSLNSRLTAASHGDVTQLLLKGDVLTALRLGKEHLERPLADGDLPRRADLGRLLGRIMLACAREEEAEELFQRQLKLYAAISRDSVRWNSSLDQATLLLHLNKLSRAIECFSAVADDRRAPESVRLEAMANAAVAMHRGGDSRAAQQALDIAGHFAESITDSDVGRLVDCLSLELSVLQRERTSEPLNDHALYDVYREGAVTPATDEELRQRLSARAVELAATTPLAARRMTHLLHMMEHESNRPAATARVGQGLTWLTERRLTGLEAHARIEATLVLIARGALTSAAELLQSQNHQEHQAQHNRYALDLQYCLAKIRQHQGRYRDAMRLYWRHSQEAVRSIKAHAGHKKTPTFLDAPPEPHEGEAAKLRLPVRYRRAYQYIIDNLNDDRLSVRQVATHIGVTERALQMAFRAHLGLTPAELIRTRRMERIHAELLDQNGTERVLDVALRWGITNRSTLAHNYRARFDKTPTQTVHGVC